MANILHKADRTKIYYVSKLIEFMRSIQLSATKGYTYYFENFFHIDKLKSVIDRLDEDYHISDTPKMRSRRNREYNRAITIGHFFYPGGDTIYFILMSKPSPTGIKHNNFFDKLKYKDLSNPKQRFVINHYELSRTNQTKQFISDEKLITDTVNEVWSYGLSPKYQIDTIKQFHNYIKDGNWAKVGYIFHELNTMLPFSKVRIDYQSLRKKLLKILNSYLKSSNLNHNEIWTKIKNQPLQKLDYFTGITINKYAISDIMNNDILKKVHKNT